MDTARLPALRPRSQRLPRVAWVLTVAAFLCGGMISAAVFSIGWRHEAQRGSSAETALVAATAQTHILRGELAVARARAVSATAARQTLAEANASLTKANAKLRTTLAQANQIEAAVGNAAAPLSRDLDRLTSELHGLGGYLASTPPGQLDAGYVQAQVAYLTKTVASFSAAVGAVQAQAAARAR